jgi:hypothetical protein
LPEVASEAIMIAQPFVAHFTRHVEPANAGPTDTN